MDDAIAQLSGRGTVTLPAVLRRKLGLRRGDLLAVRLSGGSVVLTPAAVTPVELYTDERIAELDRNADLTADELAAARRTWGVPRCTADRPNQCPTEQGQPRDRTIWRDGSCADLACPCALRRPACGAPSGTPSRRTMTPPTSAG